MDNNDIQKAKQLLDKAQDVLIVSHERPTADSIGSALTLYLGLMSLGKKVTIACPDPMTVELSGFVGVNKVATEVQKKNFVISLDYTEGSIEKVSYNIEGDKFNLVIEPRPGYDSFSAEKVHFNSVGAGVDLIFAIDTIHLGGLKKLYESDQTLFGSKPVVNIDHHANNANYGQINLVNPAAGTTVEIVAKFMSDVGIRLNEDMATNIINALYASTNSFTSPIVGAETFELVANCYRAGGKRFSGAPAVTQPQTAVVQAPARTEPIQTQPQITQPAENADTMQSKKPIPNPKDAPADWLKPKIFKSTNTL
jgi:c-di-AMP phosphodiesterase-like protein